jgi:hypothetical protein
MTRASSRAICRSNDSLKNSLQPSCGGERFEHSEIFVQRGCFVQRFKPFNHREFDSPQLAASRAILRLLRVRDSRMLLSGIQTRRTGPPIKTFEGDAFGINLPLYNSDTPLACCGLVHFGKPIEINFHKWQLAFGFNVFAHFFQSLRRLIEQCGEIFLHLLVRNILHINFRLLRFR